MWEVVVVRWFEYSWHALHLSGRERVLTWLTSKCFYPKIQKKSQKIQKVSLEYPKNFTSVGEREGAHLIDIPERISPKSPKNPNKIQRISPKNPKISPKNPKISPKNSKERERGVLTWLTICHPRENISKSPQKSEIGKISSEYSTKRSSVWER